MFQRNVAVVLKKQINMAIRRFSRKIIHTKIGEIGIPKISLHDYIWSNLNKYSNRTAIVCLETKRSYTYYELYKQSLAVSNFLTNSLKLNKHETVAIILPNLPEYFIVVLGAIQSGLKVTFCNPNSTPNEIRNQLIDSEARIVFTSSPVLATIKSVIFREMPVIEICDDVCKGLNENSISFNEIACGNSNFSPVDINVDETVFLLYSSGTTGKPKAVQLSHFNIVASLEQQASPAFNFLNIEKQDSIPAYIPFFHIYGLVTVSLLSLKMGAKLVSMTKFTSETFINLLKEHKPRIMSAVPLVVNMISNNPNITSPDLECLKFVICGAAPLGIKDLQKFQDKTDGKVSLLQAYGMTEAASVISTQTDKIEHGIKIGGSGLLLPNLQAKVAPVNGENGQGELLLKGPQIMSQYFNNSQATEESFVDGWFKTGDIVDFDENGHLFLTDRLKELIKVKGFQVAPAELEELLRNHPKIEDAAVIGVPHPVNGEAPKAFVVAKPGTTPEALEIQKFVASRVIGYKHLIGGVTFVTEIPKTPSGKILRRELRKSQNQS